MPRRLAVLPLLAALIATAVPCRAAAPNTLTEKEIADGWVQLFDGETLFGWRSADGWSVEDGAIHYAGEVGNDKPPILCTTSQFGDFELKMQYRMPSNPRSLVLLRTPPKGPVDARSKAYAASLSRGDLHGRQGAASDSPARFQPSEWNDLYVIADGGRITIKINGETANEYVDAKPLGRGHIGLDLQNLAEPATVPSSSVTAFRDIKLRPLGMKTIFNGKDLDGWKTFPELPTKVSVTDDGAMRVQNGNGMVETADSYADFTFQAEISIDVPANNSGVFFRCIPGSKMDGYECQVQNSAPEGYKKFVGDRTGGIFRRQDVRKVVAGDQEWFMLTIHADDRHIMTWVNGYAVCDWSDTRERDPNPRRGLRLEPGTIQFQGHDPTTDVRFRDIRITETPER